MIINLINQKFYIGSSKNIYYRIAKHKSRLRKNKHGNSYLQNSINKYGIEKFEVRILETCPEENLLQREQLYLDILNPEYNLVKDAIRQTKTKEFCKKMSEIMKESYKQGRSVPKRTRAVNVYNYKGEFIKTYSQRKLLTTELGLGKTSVARVLTKNTTHTQGYQLFYTDEPQTPLIITDLVVNGKQIQRKRKSWST